MPISDQENGQIEKCSASFLVRNDVEIAFRGHFGHLESIWGGPKCGFDPNEHVTNHVYSTVFCDFCEFIMPKAISDLAEIAYKANFQACFTCGRPKQTSRNMSMTSCSP